MNDFNDELAALSTAFEALEAAQADQALFKPLYERFVDIRRAFLNANPAVKIIWDDKVGFKAIPAA